MSNNIIIFIICLCVISPIIAYFFIESIDKKVEVKNETVQTPIKIDGKWGEWIYSACSKECNGGVATSSRTCLSGNCIGPNRATFDCNLQPCPINGKWSDWEVYGSCNKECGPGLIQKTRKCIEPQFGGKTCSGDDTIYEECNVKNCPIDGYWTDFETEGTCSKTCGGGKIKKVRRCIGPQFGGKPCSGDDTINVDCNTAPCSIDGQWSDYTTEGTCSKDCGGGIIKKVRKCIEPQFGGKPCPLWDISIEEACNTAPCPPVPGKWSDWVISKECKSECIDGDERISTRECIGGNCVNDSYGNKLEKKEICNLKACPKDGFWSEWKPSSCGCGSTIEKRTYTAPANGGVDAEKDGPSTRVGVCSNECTDVTAEIVGKLFRVSGYNKKTCLIPNIDSKTGNASLLTVATANRDCNDTDKFYFEGNTDGSCVIKDTTKKYQLILSKDGDNGIDLVSSSKVTNEFKWRVYKGPQPKSYWIKPVDKNYKTSYLKFIPLSAKRRLAIVDDESPEIFLT